jgi:radical SAM protein with 4Fe4S-binding SPASM domain
VTGVQTCALPILATFDTCPACKTEWVFDLYGNIYGCTASCGREEYLLGTFWPEVGLNNEAIDTWRKRDVKSIPKCRDCKYDVICGGGCGVVAANQHDGNILSPDCRPIQGLLETGVNHYIKEITAMTGDEPAEKAKKIVLHRPTKSKSGTCCTPKKTEGCLICGRDLVYTSDAPTKEICSICGLKFNTYVKCSQGHFVCDTCHSLDILGKVEQLLAASDEKNPSALAQKVFELPGLNMHGPEYHSIVPAVLVAAWQNLNGRKGASKIREAISRGKDIKGGACGFYGNCGAGVGAGTAVSIIEGATPMSRDERGAANLAAGHALLAIGRHGGPRCCKRDAITSIESFMQTTGYFRDLQKEEYICKQYGKNKDCIRKKCPYFPTKI